MINNEDLISKTIIRNVITDIIREIDKCPNDSIQDIVNEMFDKWGVDMHCTHKLTIEGKE